MIERREHDAGAERSRNWKDRFVDVLYIINVILIAATVIILLLKYVVGVWHGVPAWIPRAIFAVGWCTIWVALGMKEDK